MRDLAFIGFLVALIGMGLRRPFLLVLAYVYIDIVSPQRLTYYLLNTVPISLIAVVMAVGGWALADDKRDVRVAPRQVLMLLLILYCWATMQGADFQVEAHEKWDWVWKALVFAAFLPLTLRTRLRIEALLLFMILSAGAIVIVGGIKTIVSGGGYGQLNLMVDNNFGLYEGSTISAVAVAIVPLIFWFAKFGTIFPPDWRVKLFAWALAFACLLIPVGTAARTGLICIGIVALLSLRAAKRKVLYIGLVAAAGVVAVPFLPSAFTERMGTIQNHQADSSASTRIAVWKWTLGFVQDHPFGGGFEAYRGNRIAFDVVQKTGEGETTNKLETDKARAYHSAYFEMLGEQGWLGLALWLLLHFSGLVRMEVLRRRYRDPDGPLAWAGPLAAALQTAHAVYLFGALFVGIAFQPFVYMLVGAQIGLDTYLGRLRAETAAPARRRNVRGGQALAEA